VLRLTKDGKLQEAMTVKKFRENLPAVSAATAWTKKCTLTWSCADTSDVYLNGKPLQKYLPDFRTRNDESGQVFSAKSTISKGDVITVGARRGGSFGFLLVIVDKDSKPVWKTDKLKWQTYDPKNKERWYLPKEANKSKRNPVIINQKPWPPQVGIQKRFNMGAESIWAQEVDGTAFLVTTID
jgi:hypothetical protein